MPKNSLSIKERRKGVRIKRALCIRHRLYQSGGVQLAKRPWQLSLTVDMSVSGVLFESPTVYEVDDVIELQVTMSGVLDIVKGFGKVVRVHHNHEAEPYMIAVQYLELEPREKEVDSVKKEKSFSSQIKEKRRSAKRIR